MRRRQRSESGFSMIEMLVVVLIMGIVTAQMFLVFSTQKRVYLSNERLLDVQESARLITDLIAQDARMAGFMVPQIAGISSVDGGVANPDRLCVSDPAYFFTPLDGTASPSMDNRGNRFSGAALTAAAGTVITIPLGDLDVDGDGASPDFLVGAGIILSDGVRTHCARITGSVAGTFTLDAAHALPGGLFPALTSAVAVPAIVYEISPGTQTLTRDGLVLSTAVEDLQIEYWVDAQIPDGVIGGSEFPVYDLNTPPGGFVMDLNQIRRVQISVVTVSDRVDGQQGVEMNRYRRPAVANRAAGGRDELHRRRFTVNVLPRNLL